MSILSRLKTPKLSAGGVPEVDENVFRLRVDGLVHPFLSVSLQEIKQWPKSAVNARLTSVSGFSVRATWEGVTALPSASPILTTQRFSWSMVWKGKLWERAYGGPLRMVIPQLYGYQSAKWLSRIEIVDSMRGGYWEDRVGIPDPEL